MEPLLSLRTWLDTVDGLGELRQVRGAHWDVELGAIAELSYQRPNPVALLFDDIVGYPSGRRVLTGSTGSPRRLGHTLRLAGDPAAPADVAEFDDVSLVAALRGKPSQWAARAADYPATR